MELDAPSPDSGWSNEILTCLQAIIVPPVTSKMRQEAGIFFPDGKYCAHGETWRDNKKMTSRPDVVPDVERTLSGRWLWCGSLFDHFGHFLVESVSRLWAVDQLGDNLDGLCFIPKRAHRSDGLLRFQAGVLTAFGLDLPVHIAKETTQVDELIVPGQGFGLGDVITGTAEMRQAFHKRFGRDILPEGPERLYISRSGLDARAGGIIGEQELERLLQNEGYTVFHPQDHDIATQIARFKAAQKVIIADGSAGHLFAHVGRNDQDVAYILRRTYWADGPIQHIESFCEKRPMIIDQIRREWHPHDRKKHHGVSFVQHDLPDMQEKLITGQFIEKGTIWPEITNDFAISFLRLNNLADDFSPTFNQ